MQSPCGPRFAGLIPLAQGSAGVCTPAPRPADGCPAPTHVCTINTGAWWLQLASERAPLTSSRMLASSPGAPALHCPRSFSPHVHMASPCAHRGIDEPRLRPTWYCSLPCAGLMRTAASRSVCLRVYPSSHFASPGRVCALAPVFTPCGRGFFRLAAQHVSFYNKSIPASRHPAVLMSVCCTCAFHPSAVACALTRGPSRYDGIAARPAKPRADA